MVTEVALDAKHWRIVQDFSPVVHVCPSEHQEATDLTKGVKMYKLDKQNGEIQYKSTSYGLQINPLAFCAPIL